MLPLVVMVDETKIGAYIGKGLQHKVYDYGTDEVIKIPHLWMRLTTTVEQKQKEIAIAKQYFTDNLPETRVEAYRNSYCYIQKKIEGLSPLTLSHLDTHRPNIVTFLEKNQRLVKEQKLSADLLGGYAYAHALTRHAHGKPILSANMVINENAFPHVYLLDTDLLRTSLFHFYGLREIPFVIGTWAFYMLNNFTLKHYDIL